MFLNNSLGIGLEQIYALGVEHLAYCEEPSQKPTWHLFTLLGDLRFVRERLYATSGNLDLAGLALGRNT
jgi:hypothetical protein